jgi:hypothetical protein
MSVIEYFVIGGALLLSLYFNLKILARKRKDREHIQSITNLIFQTATIKNLIDVLASSIADNPMISVACINELQKRGLSYDNIVKMVAQAKHLDKIKTNSKNGI